MELKDFIKRALLDIVNGVDQANQENKRFKLTGQKHHGTGESGESVEFDISVIVNESSEKDINGGIKVALMNIGGGRKESETNQNIHKIKFDVFITEK